MRKFTNPNPKPYRQMMLADGVIRSAGVDQFPVKPFQINANGFPKNDATVLLEAASLVGVDSDRFAQIASRINVLRSIDSNKGKTIQDIWKTWRPAMCQSPSELKQFEAWYYENYEEDLTSGDVETAEKPVDSVESSSGTQTTEAA